MSNLETIYLFITKIKKIKTQEESLTYQASISLSEPMSLKINLQLFKKMMTSIYFIIIYFKETKNKYFSYKLIAYDLNYYIRGTRDIISIKLSKN